MEMETREEDTVGFRKQREEDKNNVLLVWSGSYEKSGTRNPNVGIVECGRTDRRNIKYDLIV